MKKIMLFLFTVLLVTFVSGCVSTPEGERTSTSKVAPSCTPNWECTEWGKCTGTWLSASQTRTCTDTINCGTASGKPAETLTCQVPRTTSKEPFELALQLSALPEGFEIGERTERTTMDVSYEGKNLGWKKGYYIRFNKFGETIFQITTIEQYISIYPVENISKILQKGAFDDTNVTVAYFSDPKIGDKSKAYKIINPDTMLTGFVIEFTKYDVYIILTMSGTVGIDYELFKDLAKNVENKIS